VVNKFLKAMVFFFVIGRIFHQLLICCGCSFSGIIRLFNFHRAIDKASCYNLEKRFLALHKKLTVLDASVQLSTCIYLFLLKFSHKLLTSKVRMAEWFKAPDSSSGPLTRAWVQIPLLTYFYFLFEFFFSFYVCCIR
jgi:hypothetical protein